MAGPQYVYVMKGLSKTFPGGRQILKDIWLSFLPGAKIGVIGVNGSGKSTLLRMMAGIDTEFTGEAWAADGVRVGYLPQEPELDPQLNVLGNVMEAVAEKAGIAKPTLYAWYRDKAELFTAVLRRLIEQVEKRTRESCQSPGGKDVTPDRLAPRSRSHSIAIAVRVLKKSGVGRAAEPRRLLEAREYRAAVISAMAALEASLREQLNKVPWPKAHRPLSLRTLVDIAVDRGIVNPELKTRIDAWMRTRNEVVHSSIPVTAARAQEIVNGVLELIDRWRANNSQLNP